LLDDDQNDIDLDCLDNSMATENSALNVQNSPPIISASRARSRSRNRKGLRSAVWGHFDTKTPTHPNESKQPVCKQCKVVFASKTATSTLRRHLISHKIVAPKRQKTLHDYRSDPYTEHEQR